jgi:hypothetical protein
MVKFLETDPRGKSDQLERGIGESITAYAGQIVDVGPPGYSLQVSWAAASGASKAEVNEAAVQIDPIEVEEPIGDLTLNVDSSKLFADVTVPAGKRIKALNLQNLKDKDNALLTTQSDLSSRGLRLVVTVRDASGAFGPPLHAVPACPDRGMLPPMLNGASYSAGSLRFDQPLDTSKIRLALARNDFPEDLEADPMSLGKVSGVAAVTPRDLTLSDPSGGTVWNFPGEMPSGLPTSSADLRLALEKAVTDALQTSAGLNFTFKLQASAPAKARVRFSGAKGSLLRQFPGVLKSALEGEPVVMPLEGPALASGQPASAIADLTVRYQGVRILETVSDPMPGGGSPIGGVVVTDQPVLRTFPPGAFGSLPLARIGLVGRAPEAGELVVQVVDLAHGEPGTPAGPPAVKKLEPSPAVHIEWLEILEFKPTSGPLGLVVHTNQGRFFWASVAQPLVRIAVFDPDPGGRWLKLAGQNILSVSQAEFHQPGFSLPASAFKSIFPSWESDLFLKVDLSDLVLRYSR